ncbi:MAG: hypothetical protein JWP30_129 [Homoserinimonas sp.]|nr:hypothetical protein [Homoserinimonas sp.]
MPRGTKGAPGPLSYEIAATIRGELARQKMSKTHLAQEVGISLPQLSKIVAGLKRVDIEDLEAILTTLGLNLRQVLSNAEAATQSRRLG